MLTTSRPQCTIAGDTEVRGIGFFHNGDVTLRLRPAGADVGVVFVRTDLSGRPRIPATLSQVVPRPRRTAIGQGEVVVEMVEHVMAALAGMGVDNCVVELDSPEPPGCDGSSRAFVEAIASVGLVPLDVPREIFVITKPVTVREGQALLTAWPSEGPGLTLSYQLDYGADTPIGVQSLALGMGPGVFERELGSCRTFLTEAEALALRASGIGRRATETDLLIFGPEGPINNTLRYADECVRHKMLDMVGDFALLGKDIRGHVAAYRSGHQLNASLLRALIAAEIDRNAA